MLSLWRKWIAYPLGWLAITLLGMLTILLLSTPNSADPPMKHFKAVYTATKVGSQVHVNVEESIRDTLDPSRLGITRVLVPHFDGQDLGLGPITVKDPDGEPYEFTQRTLPNGDVELLIDRNDPRPRYSTTTFDFLISYSLARTVATEGQAQELALNVNGTEWTNGFDTVSAQLVIDPSLAGHLTGDAFCTQGRAGSNETCTITRDGDTFSASANHLGAYENMTLSVGLKPGTVADPLNPMKARSHGWWGIAGLVGIGLAALAVALITRRIVRVPSKDELGIVTQFTPPKDLEPVLAADFLGVPERGAAAHLAWIVAEGMGELTSSWDATAPAPAANLSPGERAAHRSGLRLTWFDPSARPQSKLNGYMRSITEALFGGAGKQRSLDHVRGFSSLSHAQQLRDAALANKMLRSEILFGPLMLWAGYLAIMGYGLYQVWIGLAGLGWPFLFAGFIAVMLVLWAFHLLPVHGRLSSSGREMQRYLAGLERFITTSEGERIQWMNSVETAPRDEESRVALYEKLLPWAIVFGVENSWQQVLGSMYSRFPERERRALALPGATTPSTWADRSHTRRETPSRWDSRPNWGQGAITRGFASFAHTVGDVSRGTGSSSSSTRSSGRGWSGGSSGRSSSGGRSSGGGRGGGGGGRR
ncbi:MAG: DUF2207 domain-containing protein [Propionibacteriaceae bacterium]|nr:DUF2207 domain-containing protein [Propionibacteriaceae bacterium]